MVFQGLFSPAPLANLTSMTTRDPDVAPDPRAVPPERPGPRGGKRDRNRRLRTRAIADAALARFLVSGIDGVTIGEITRTAGVAKGSFYRYFADKEDLVAALFEPCIGRLEDAFEACDRALEPGASALAVFGAYHSLGMALGGLVTEMPGVIQLYLQERRLPAGDDRAPIHALSDRISDVAVDLTRAAHARKLLRPCNPRVSALAVVGAAERLLEDVLAGRLEGDPAALTAELVGIMLEGLKPL